MKTFFLKLHIPIGSNSIFFIPFGLCLIFLFYLSGCKKEAGDLIKPLIVIPTPEKDIDSTLYQMAKNTDGFTWFGLSSASLNKSAKSGHGQPLLRTRYNDIAATLIDENGRVIEGSKFTDGALIVKELLDAQERLEIYAILYKDADNKYADDKGWVWGYMNVDGSVAETAKNKGKGCTGCHSIPGNIDYGLMNISFPL